MKATQRMAAVIASGIYSIVSNALAIFRASRKLRCFGGKFMNTTGFYSQNNIWVACLSLSLFL